MVANLQSAKMLALVGNMLATAMVAPPSLFAHAAARAAAPVMGLAPGDTVAVIGASGNVGKLVALRLAESFKVRGVVRDASRCSAFLGDKVELFEADLRSDDVTTALAPALEGAQGLVVCTGTTAFPTTAWSPSGRDDVAQPVLGALWQARQAGGLQQIVSAAIDDLSAQGFNTPKVVDTDATLKLLKAWQAARLEHAPHACVHMCILMCMACA